jgi:hypothetical protein
MIDIKPKWTKINDNELRQLYEFHHKSSLEDFRTICLNIIKAAASPNNLLIEALKRDMSKDKMLMRVNNFAFAGQGLKVLKI